MRLRDRGGNNRRVVVASMWTVLYLREAERERLTAERRLSRIEEE
jgi:hypothetical protein